MTQVVDLLVQLMGFLLQFHYRFILRCRGVEELIFRRIQQVFNEGASLFGLFNGTEGTRHRRVAFLLRL